MPKTIVIVGAGFSGVVVAANLLRQPTSTATDIVLVERGASMGRGVAYADREYPYLLNVPASRLSADSRDQMQFLRFAQQRVPGADGEDFLPRSLYGDYLQDVLLKAERAAPDHVRLQRTFGEVTSIRHSPSGAPLKALFKDREPMAADIVILALGNPPAALPPWAAELRDHSGFRQDALDLPGALRAEDSVLIVGNGLTMVDAAAALSRDADRVPTLHTISRRGLIPKTQTMFHAGAVRGSGEALLESAASLKRLLRASRAMAREVENLGGDWREVVAFIRNLAPSLWLRLPEVERRRFVRHLQVHWDIYRHRLPPQLMARIDDLRRSGKLHINAGRIQHAAAVDGRLQVSWRPRGSDATATLMVDMIINATGPNYAIDRSVDPLVNALRAAGVISADPLSLGIRTGPYGACLDATGRASSNLYYLGPMLRADHLDATAAAELRDHAERLAAHLSDKDA